MSASVVLRAAHPEEAARIHELHVTSVRALCSAHYSVEILDAWLGNRTAEGYMPRIASGALFVAERDGRIVGFGEAAPGTVIAVYVDPQAVRQGVGVTILRHAVAMARRAHDGPVRLEATLNAREFYERAGFREVMRTTTRRNNVDIPVVVMELRG